MRRGERKSSKKRGRWGRGLRCSSTSRLDLRDGMAKETWEERPVRSGEKQENVVALKPQKKIYQERKRNHMCKMILRVK